MAYKYKKWRIRWQPDKKRFKKIKRDRKKSRDAYHRWRKNKGKMLAALRKSKPKRKLTNRKNKAKGLYKKLSVARSRWKNILKSDVNLENFLDGRLFLEDGYEYLIEGPVIDLEETDISEIISILKSIQDNHEWDDSEDSEIAQQFIEDSIEQLEEVEDTKELIDTDEDFLEELIAFIEEYAEDIGAMEDDDENEEDKDSE